MKSLQTDSLPEDLSYELKRLVKKILRYEAGLILKKYKPKVIAITGSVGKTLTREAIYSVLSKKFFVRKSEKSFTAEIGIPLLIIGCSQGTGTIFQWIKNILFGLRLIVFKTRYPEWLILEVDNDKVGDLKAVSSFLATDILVLTAIGDVPAHIENFPSIDDFILEKKSIVNKLKKDGVLIYNADDDVTESISKISSNTRISCGLDPSNDISGSDFTILYDNSVPVSSPTGMSFDIRYKKKSYPMTISGSLGVQNIYASLLAFAVAMELKISPEAASGALCKCPKIPGRMSILEGIKDSVIIDDSYNSHPEAMSQALEVLNKINSSGKKIVVVGDMLELGRFSTEEHIKIAGIIKKIAKEVMVVGIRAKKIKDELLDLGFKESHIKSFDNSYEAGKELQKIIRTGDVVLIKGSQGMRMEKTVEEVMKNPKDKKKLLVRQGEEWLIR